MRIAYMDNAGEIACAGQLEMSTKNSTLYLARREHAVIVETELSDCHNLWFASQCAQVRTNLFIISSGIVWMDTDASEDSAWMCLCQGERSLTGRQVYARVNDARHASADGRVNNGFAVGIEAGGIDMCVAIDEHYNLSFPKDKQQKKERYCDHFISCSIDTSLRGCQIGIFPWVGVTCLRQACSRGRPVPWILDVPTSDAHP